MVTYLLHCSICKDYYAAGEAWTRHLLQEGHQEGAKVDILKWDVALKKSALVAFFSDPIKKGEEEDWVVLLWNYLKRKTGGVGGGCGFLISDFVWWRQRPTMAVLLFDTPKTANLVYKNILAGGGSKKPKCRVGNYCVQFRKRVHLLKFEWETLCPAGSSSRGPCKASAGPSPPVKKAKKKAASSPSPSTSSAAFQVNRRLSGSKQKVNIVTKKKGDASGNKKKALKGPLKIKDKPTTVLKNTVANARRRGQQKRRKMKRECKKKT